MFVFTNVSALDAAPFSGSHQISKSSVLKASPVAPEGLVTPENLATFALAMLLILATELKAKAFILPMSALLCGYLDEVVRRVQPNLTV